MALNDKEIKILVDTLLWKVETSIGGATKPYLIRNETLLGIGLSGTVSYRFSDDYTPGQITKDFCILIDRRIQDLKLEHFFRSVLKNNREIMIRTLEAVKSIGFWNNYLNQYENVETLLVFYSLHWTKNPNWTNEMIIHYGYGKEVFHEGLTKYIKEHFH